ncbi:hypothetical protein TNCV_1578561 [Trichonephila clavipes]|nr:hypothetical protein TNCV_1578561 [Trichonephila clavipes]
MEDSSGQSFIPTNLGRVDEEMIPQGRRVSQTSRGPKLAGFIENHVTSVTAPYDDPSRTSIARSAPRLFASTTPIGFYDEY